MKNLTVGEVMDPAPPYVRAGQPLDEVVELLIKHHVGGLPVVNDQREVIGFVSEQDCIHSLKVSSYHCEGIVRVEDVMNRDAFTVPPEMSILDLVESMGSNKPKVFPVTKDGKLAGLICRPQVLRVLAEASIGCGFTFKEAN